MEKFGGNFERKADKTPEQEFRKKSENFLRRRNFLLVNEKIPSFERCLLAFIKSTLNLAKFIEEHDIKTLIYLDRGSRNIEGPLKSAAQILNIEEFPKVRFIDNHLLLEKETDPKKKQRYASPPILILDEIACTGKSLNQAKAFFKKQYKDQEIYTGALSVHPLDVAAIDFRGQELTGLNLGYWYLAEDKPKQLEKILNQISRNYWPADFMFTPVSRNPKQAWFDERNPNKKELKMWRDLNSYIKKSIAEKIKQLQASGKLKIKEKK